MNGLVICPVYNEADTISDFYQDLRKHYQGDVLFIDDGSTDRGKEYISDIKDPNTFAIGHPQRRGYGAALISGFGFASRGGYNQVVTIDVDLQHKPERLSLFFNELGTSEVVLGSRYIKVGKCLDIPRDRLVINRYIAGLLNRLFSYNFTDPFCGFRGYRDSFLNKIELYEQSYGASLELLLEIIRTKTQFKEIPVEAIYFKDLRKFLDGLDDSRRRLLYYLEVISQKKKRQKL